MKRTSLLGALAALLAASSAAHSQTKPAITCLAVAPEGKAVVIGSQAGVRVRTLEDQKETKLATQLDHVCALAFSPDGKLLAIGGGAPAEAGSMELWSWPEAKLQGRLEGHTDVVHGVAWLQQGKQLATASADRTVGLWDVPARKRLHTLEGHSGPVLAVAASPDDKWLCTGSADHTIRVWNAADGKPVRALTNHLGPVYALAFRPAATGQTAPYLASVAEDGTARIWQPSIGRLVRIIRHDSPVYAAAWSKDGAHLFTGAKDGKVRTIDGDSDTIVHTTKPAASRITALAIDARSANIIAGNAQGNLSVLP